MTRELEPVHAGTSFCLVSPLLQTGRQAPPVITTRRSRWVSLPRSVTVELPEDEHGDYVLGVSAAGLVGVADARLAIGVIGATGPRNAAR